MKVLTDTPADIVLRPMPLFAMLKVLPLLICALGFLFLAWRWTPAFLWLSTAITVFAVYRYFYIRRVVYLITPEILQFSRGLFFRRTDTIELFRVKDYIITCPLLMQLFGLMDLTLKTTDPENRVVWLRGIPFSDLTDVLRERIIAARGHNQIVEIN